MASEYQTEIWTFQTKWCPILQYWSSIQIMSGIANIHNLTFSDSNTRQFWYSDPHGISELNVSYQIFPLATIFGGLHRISAAFQFGFI